MGWVLMSEREIHRVEVLSGVVAGRMSTSEVASALCLSDRQVQRLLKTFCEDGAVALWHKARKRPWNNRSFAGLRDLTLVIVRERYAHFGPTLAAEKLAERDGVKSSRETLRKWMIEDELWLFAPSSSMARCTNGAVALAPKRPHLLRNPRHATREPVPSVQV